VLSWWISLTLTPMMCSRLLQAENHQHARLTNCSSAPSGRSVSTGRTQHLLPSVITHGDAGTMSYRYWTSSFPQGLFRNKIPGYHWHYRGIDTSPSCMLSARGCCQHRAAGSRVARSARMSGCGRQPANNGPCYRPEIQASRTRAPMGHQPLRPKSPGQGITRYISGQDITIADGCPEPSISIRQPIRSR